MIKHDMIINVHICFISRRNKASVNKYRGHVPPLGKAKERSLSPISKRRQLHDTMREQMVTKVLGKFN